MYNNLKKKISSLKYKQFSNSRKSFFFNNILKKKYIKNNHVKEEEKNKLFYKEPVQENFLLKNFFIDNLLLKVNNKVINGKNTLQVNINHNNVYYSFMNYFFQKNLYLHKMKFEKQFFFMLSDFSNFLNFLNLFL
jgi:hypothetical protein